MNKFQPLVYLKKYAAIVIAFFAILTVGLYMVLRSMQTYTAEMVLNYTYDNAEVGLTPNGNPFDASEIYSSNVISQALGNLGLSQAEYSIDEIRSSFYVEQIEDEAINAVNEAKNKEGEKSDLQSTKYRVGLTLNHDMGPYMARLLLDEIMDVYFTQFSQKYVNTATVVNSTSAINQGGYDYVEQMELIEDSLQSTIKSLSSRAQSDTNFYSSDSGYSFDELVDQFALLRNTQVSSTYAYIMKHRVTRDQVTLLDKYSQRVKSNHLQQEKNKARVSEVEGILNAYVEKLRASNNTAQSQVLAEDGTVSKNGNVLGDVESPNYTNDEDRWVAYDQTTEYEQLLQNWIDISDIYNRSIIDAKYSQYVIDCFTGNTDAVLQYQTEVSQITNLSGNDTELGVSGDIVQADNIQAQLSADIYTEGTVPCTQADLIYVEEKIEGILSRMNELYEITAVTDAEFNEYLGAEYIQVLSGNHVSEGMNVKLYTLVGAFLFLVVGCLGVILLGRAGDIVEYMVYTDHMYHLPNRAACDRYIQKYSEKVLAPGMGYIYFQILNQNEINRMLGRKGGDEVLEFFASSLKSVFDIRRTFVGYNGSAQFMVFVQKTNQGELKEAVRHLNIILNDKYQDRKILLHYTAASSVSTETDTYRIRSLISEAMKNKISCQAGASGEGADGEKKE